MNWSDRKGFWFVLETVDECGLSVSVVWIQKIKDIQLSFLLGCVRIAVGYTF